MRPGRQVGAGGRRGPASVFDAQRAARPVPPLGASTTASSPCECAARCAPTAHAGRGRQGPLPRRAPTRSRTLPLLEALPIAEARREGDSSVPQPARQRHPSAEGAAAMVTSSASSSAKLVKPALMVCLLALLASSASAQRFGLGRPGGPGGVGPEQFFPPADQGWPPARPPASGPGQRPPGGVVPLPGRPAAGQGPGHHGPGYPAYGDSDGLGSPCNYDEDCDWMEHTYCRNQQACECKRGFLPSASSDRCLATVGAPCSTKYDCAGLGAAGECRQGVCDCGTNNVPAPDGTCLKAALRVNDWCVEDMQCEGLGVGGGQAPGTPGLGVGLGHGPGLGRPGRPGQWFAGARCVDGKCQCAVGKHASNDGERCIDNRALHEPCSYDGECYIGEGYQSVIRCHMGTCRCRENYVDIGDGKCTAGAEKFKTGFTSVTIILGILTRWIL